jgi:hypothetical protein
MATAPVTTSIPPVPPVPPLPGSSVSSIPGGGGGGGAVAVAGGIGSAVAIAPPPPPLPVTTISSSSSGSSPSKTTTRPIITQIIPPPPPPPSSSSLSSSVDSQNKNLPVYLTITNLKASIDSTIDQYVQTLAERVTLKEVPVNGSSGASNSSITKFNRIDGDFPKLQVDLYEQMVYHRSESTNKNPLKIFVPTRYKINHQKIIQYFSTKAGDEATKALVSGVIEPYGKNNNSLFYEHTISGSNNSSGLDLDDNTSKDIQKKIDKWHNDYAGWTFYDNASTFFIQNREIPREELMLLNTDLAEVFDKPDGAEGLLAMVKGLSDKYKSLNDTYIAQGKTVIKLINDTVVPYVAFFMKVFADVKKHMTDQLNFITNRKGNMGYSYDFNDSIKASIFKTYEEIKMVLDNLGITNEIPLLNILSIINTLKTKIFDPNKGFPLKPIFDDYILNGKKFLLPGTRDNYDSYNKTEIVVTLTSKYIDATVPEDFVTKYVLSNDTTTTGKVSFGFKPNELDIDILFYLLYRATNNVIYAIMKEQKEFEKIDENKNDELRKPRQEVDIKEKKLKQVCE